NRSEVLFVDYILEHLRPNGRAGIIVPEGIIFQSATAYKALRKLLIEDGLLAVVSLPAGVFNPYAGVKTSILLFDNGLAKKTKEILFLKIQNDGFDLGAQRRGIDKNDLPLALEVIKAYKNILSVMPDLTGHPEKLKKELDSRLRGNDKWRDVAHLAAKDKIAESGDYNLSGDRYKEVVNFANQKWPMVELGEVCEILDSQRKPVKEADRKQGPYPYYGATGIVDYVDKYIFDEKLVLVGEDGAKWGVGEKTAFIADGKYWVNNHAHVLRPDREKLLDDFLVPMLNRMDLAPYVTGVTVPKLNQEKLRSIKIPLPPLEVQKEIVEQIEVKQKAIEAAKAVIDNLERERDAILANRLER
ncbi:MAG: restriction endonuclease subunit S, partial [Deltaproteobacteria bacterium]|nr:restriction endonuclease subunit S [Deltaproteobacteria bacterium]